MMNTIHYKDKCNFHYLIISVFLACFSIVLTSPLSTYGIQIGLLMVVTGLMFMLSGTKFRLSNLILLITIVLLLVGITSIQSIYLKHQELLWLQVSRVVFWISTCFLAYPYIIRASSQDIKNALKTVILLSSLAVYIQFVCFYLFNQVIDFSIMTGGTPSRIHGIVFRPSGITSEPAIHSGIMIGLLTLHYIQDKKNKVYVFLGITSVLLTMSIYGILSSFVFLSIIFFKKNLKTLLFVPLLTATLLFFTLPILSERYVSYQDGKDASNMTKIDSVYNLIAKPHLTYLGYGMTGRSKSAPTFYEGLYDMTAFGAVFILFGIPLGFLLFPLMIFSICMLPFSLKEKLLIFLSFAKISSPTFIFFNVFVMFLAIFVYQRKKLNLCS